MKILLAKGGPNDGNAYAIGPRTLIGRAADCDIQVIDKGVSRRHACVLEQEDGSVLVRDLGSSNGTLVAGELVREVVLQAEDEILIGESGCFIFREMQDHSPITESLEIKLVSGPAAASTVVESLSDIEARALEDELKRRRVAANESEQYTVSKTSVPPPMPDAEPVSIPPSGAMSIVYCCDDPLAARAHRKGWAFCPACGTTLK